MPFRHELDVRGVGGVAQVQVEPRVRNEQSMYVPRDHWSRSEPHCGEHVYDRSRGHGVPESLRVLLVGHDLPLEGLGHYSDDLAVFRQAVDADEVTVPDALGTPAIIVLLCDPLHIRAVAALVVWRVNSGGLLGWTCETANKTHLPVVARVPFVTDERHVVRPRTVKDRACLGVRDLVYLAGL